MELDRLRYFYEVARLGSVTAAARTLRVSQPSLSKSVRLLETNEGVTLFVRSKRGVELTEDGKRVYRSCQLIFGELASLRASIAQNRDIIAGELSIGASDNICNYLLPRICDRFLKAYPAVQLRVFSGSAPQIQNEIVERGSELGLFYTKLENTRDLSSEKICSVEFVIVSPRPAMLKDLEKLSYIGSRRSEYGSTYTALEMLSSIGIQPKTVFETNNQETQKRMALTGTGYTLVPLHMVKDELKTKALHRVRTPGVLEAPIFIVRKQRRPISRIAQLFESELRKGLT